VVGLEDSETRRTQAQDSVELLLVEVRFDLRRIPIMGALSAEHRTITTHRVTS